MDATAADVAAEIASLQSEMRGIKAEARAAEAMAATALAEIVRLQIELCDSKAAARAAEQKAQEWNSTLAAKVRCAPIVRRAQIQ